MGLIAMSERDLQRIEVLSKVTAGRMTMVSAAHVVWEARSAKPISVARWLAFAVAQGVFGYDLWVNIGDATGKRVFLTMLLLRGLFLLVARWVVTKNQGDSHG